MSVYRIELPHLHPSRELTQLSINFIAAKRAGGCYYTLGEWADAHSTSSGAPFDYDALRQAVGDLLIDELQGYGPLVRRSATC